MHSPSESLSIFIPNQINNANIINRTQLNISITMIEPLKTVNSSIIEPLRTINSSEPPKRFYRTFWRGLLRKLLMQYGI